MTSTVCVGLIADTHGLLRPEAVEALRGCDHIVHAGDIGKPAVIDGLRAVGPVTAIRGNVDTGAWAEAFPETATVRIAGRTVHVVHDLKTLAGVPAECDVVVSGHSHQPRVERRDGVLFVNPGSAGPRRFRLPVTVALLRLGDGVEVRRVELPGRAGGG